MNKTVNWESITTLEAVLNKMERTQKAFEALSPRDQLQLICDAVNDGWMLDKSNQSQEKWMIVWTCSIEKTGGGSVIKYHHVERLPDQIVENHCFENGEKAKHAAKYFQPYFQAGYGR